MPNPFDQFDSAVAGGNPFDRFDEQPTHRVAEAPVQQEAKQAPLHEYGHWKMALLFADQPEKKKKLDSLKEGQSFDDEDFGKITKTKGGFTAPDLEEMEDNDSDGVVKALASSAAMGAPRGAAFLGAMGATSRLTGGLANLGPLGKAGAVVLPLVAGTGAAMLAGAGERKALESIAPDALAKADELQQEYPKTSFVGEALTSGFKPGLPRASLAEELLSRAAPAALGAGTQAVTELATAPEGETMGEGALGRIGGAALQNAILRDPTTAGHTLMNIGAATAEHAVPSLITKIDSLGKGASNTKINETVALGGEPTGAPKAVDSPEMPFEAPGPGEDLSGIGYEFSPRDYPEFDAPLGLEKAKRTPAASPAQKQIEDFIGISNKKGAKEEDIRYNAEVRDHAKTRSEIEEADRIASMVADQAGSPDVSLKEPLDFGADKPSLAEKLGLKKEVEGRVDVGGQIEKTMAFNDKVKSIITDLADNGVKVTRQKAAEMARMDPRDYTKARAELVQPEAPLTKTTPLVLKDFNEIPDSTFKAPAAEPPSAATQAAQGEIAASRGLGDLKPIPDTWKLTVQEPVIPGNPKTGYTQIDMLDANGKNAGSTTPEKLREEGYDVPDLSKVKTGQYTAKQLGATKAVQITPSGERGRLYAVPPSMGAPIAGALIGYQFGDTPEEKRRNALIGALLGSGATLTPRLVKALAKASPAFLSKINATAADAKAKGNSTWDRYLSHGKSSPTTEVESLEKNFSVPPGQLAEAQDAPSGNTASPSPRYQYTPWLSRTSVGAALKKAFGTIEGNIMAVSQRVGGVLRAYNGRIDELKVQWTKGTYAFGKAVRAVMSPQQVKELDYEIQFGSHAKAEQMLAAQPNGDKLVSMFRQAKATYNDMAAAEEAAGRTINRVEDAWPRQMLDYRKFRKALSLEERGAFEEKVASIEKSKKRPLSDHEKADVINDAISLNLRGKPSFLKARTVEGLTLDQFLNHYEPFDVSMDNRIAKVSRDVARREYTGQESPEDPKNWDGKTGHFGAVIQAELPRIGYEGQEVIIQNLKDHLRIDGTAGNALAEIGNKISRLQNLAYLGDISTSVAQFGDFFVNMRRYGLSASLQGLMDRKIKLEDLGLGSDTFAETLNMSRGEHNQGVKGVVRRAQSELVQRMVGWADKVNKESTVNAARAKFTEVLRDPHSPDYVRLYKKYSERFPEEWPSILKDLKSKDFADGKLNKNTRFFLFNELADIQPISMAQRAQLENASPGIRFAYSLKRYWIKQLDIMRQEGYELLKQPGRRMEALKNIGSYLTIVSLMQGIAIGTIRDIMFGRDVDLEENGLSGVFQSLGFNRYMLESIRDRNLGKAVAEWALPSFGLANDAYSDYSKATNGELDFDNSKLLKYTPVIGREMYYWEGAGVQAKEKAAARDEKIDSGLPPTLDSLSKMILPPASKRK